MLPSPPSLQCLRPLLCLLSRFLPRTTRNRGIYLARLVDQTGGVSMCPSQRQSDIRPSLQTILLVRFMVFQTASQKVPSHQTRDLECFADGINIPGNQPTIRCPKPGCNISADVPSFTLRTALSAIPFVSDLCAVDVQ